MIRQRLYFALIFFFPFSLSAQKPELKEQNPEAEKLDEIFRIALTDCHAYPWLGYMCNHIGHRLSGSPAADQAVEYAFHLMDSLGLNPVKQPCMVPVWQRGAPETAFYMGLDGVVKNVDILALGGSVPTPTEGIEAELIEVSSWEELAELGEQKVKGKIVLFNEPMNPENIYTFHSYGHCVKHRWGGASEAAKYGAVGALVRSLNLRIDNFPHTGSMHYEAGADSIPAAAIPTVVADELSKKLHEGERVEFWFKQNCRQLPDKQSYNVFGEIKGSKYPERIIIIGGHLDSWDVGQGAHDDGAGVMQSLAVLEILKKMNYQPENTIRVVFFMNEENGLRGAKAYGEAAKTSGETHIAAIESDRGGFTPRGFNAEGNQEIIDKIIKLKPLLEKYGLHQLEEGGSGADIKPLQTNDNVLIGFVPDSQRYFDHHHAQTDTFDAINKRELEMGTASIASLVFLLDSLVF